jgi:hypothetical protein
MFFRAATVAFFFWGAFAVASKLPTQYVDCVNDSKGQPIASRQVKSPVITSTSGDHVYAVVVAKQVSQRCEITAIIYMASGKGPYRQIFRRGQIRNADGTFDDNGIQELAWSPSGKHLLAVIFRSRFASDADVKPDYLLFSTGRAHFLTIRPEDAVHRRFKTDCTAEIELSGWLDDSHLLMTAKPFVMTDEEGVPDKTPPCGETVSKFSFDTDSGAFKKLPK